MRENSYSRISKLFSLTLNTYLSRTPIRIHRRLPQYYLCVINLHFIYVHKNIRIKLKKNTCNRYNKTFNRTIHKKSIYTQFIGKWMRFRVNNVAVTVLLRFLKYALCNQLKVPKFRLSGTRLVTKGKILKMLIQV